MTFDFIWLYFHIIILLGIMIREYARPHQRNLFAIVFCGAFFVLVSAQDWWMLNKFNLYGFRGMTHLNQSISLMGVQLANYYTGIAVVCYWFTYWLFTKRNQRVSVGKINTNSAHGLSFFPYVILFGWVIAVAVALVKSAGGIEESLVNPGLNQAFGVTMFLILISVGKFPLMHKIVTGKPIKIFDIVLFVIVLLLVLFNARLNVGLILLQVIFLTNYCRYEIPRRLLLLVPTLIFIVFIVFGLYREFASHAEGVVSKDLLFEFAINYFDLGVLLDWFYAANVEGFAGLAGILTYDENIGGIFHDFGLSNLSFIFQFIPGSIRTDPSLPLLEISQGLVSIYPYRNGSLIPPGLEMAFGNFGVLGVIAFGAILGYLTQLLHVSMLNVKRNRLKVGVLSVQILHAIRGPFSNVIFFALSDLIMLTLYKIIISTSKYESLFNHRSEVGNEVLRK